MIRGLVALRNASACVRLCRKVLLAGLCAEEQKSSSFGTPLIVWISHSRMFQLCSKMVSVRFCDHAGDCPLSLRSACVTRAVVCDADEMTHLTALSFLHSLVSLPCFTCR